MVIFVSGAFSWDKNIYIGLGLGIGLGYIRVGIDFNILLSVGQSRS